MMTSYTRGAPTVFFISAVCMLARAGDWEPSGGRVPFKGGRYSGHPMLYFGREAVPELQGAALSTHAELAQQVWRAGEDMLANPAQFLPPRDPKEFSARWNEIYGNNLGVLALFCLLYPERTGALGLAREYMDRMAAQPSWLVKDAPWDEVPMAHSLVGFATAYDFLYEFLSEAEQERYLQVLGDASLYMYDKSLQRGWGFQFLHNHQPTNCVALLTASLVLLNQGCVQEAYVFIRQVMLIMEKALVLLRSVVDGSLSEGVAYGTYSTRSLFQYIFLLQRHFNVSHFTHPWLLKHYDFLYRTLLPGFQRNVAIADSNYNWFYGPESQLVFLDRYVLRNGHANFLAEEIRRRRVQEGPGQPSRAQKWCTLHTELIWYDAGLKATPPADFGTPRLHYFEDWGVVTYGGGLPAETNHSFLSFKSGKLGGRTIFDIVHQRRYSDWIKGWKNFNSGHEHPDQNSFTFAPRGFPFITEALYGPKYTLLNNAVLFAPSADGACFSPWEGQVTEACDSKWSKYKTGPAADCEGRVEAALERQGVVFIRGEGRAAYSPSLRIKNLQRNLVLLQPDLLLLLDHVHLDSESPAHSISAFFHNIDLPFQRTVAEDGVHGASVQHGQDAYTMLWRDDTGYSGKADTAYWGYPQGYPYNGTHYVNVTMPLRFPHTRIAYVFFGPDVDVLGLSLRGDSERVDVQLSTRDHTFTVHILTSENPSKPLFAMVLKDQAEKVVFERAAAVRERPLLEVPDYNKEVDRNIRQIKPVFQQLQRRGKTRLINAEGFRKIAERLKKTSEKRRRVQKKVAEAVENMFSSNHKLEKVKALKKVTKIRVNESAEKEQRQRGGASRPESSTDGGDVPRGRKDAGAFEDVRAAAGMTEVSAPLSYIRVFLVLNIGAFFLLLAVLLTQLQRAPSLHTQRCIYCVLLLDSFILLGLYSSCSRGDC
ncbi:dermatan-sulfate epimerase [Clarias gariepinus]|uniref:dermatan-sulfate epimerase n=1 Tax=Clarias gariepinus TaxID=13013 RepID=UPI00234CE7E9|nr:dermatan-sulfate epimerase [Clarias gariepinus]